jgi:hypothetical protein
VHRPNAGVSFWTKEENLDVKWREIPSELNLSFIQDSLGCLFPEYAKGLLHFLIPENKMDSLMINLKLHKSEKER